MTKFNTTNSNLFNNKNKEQVPEWMEKIADVDIKSRPQLDLDIEKRGSFADQTQVYRTEISAEPRYLDQYNKNKIVVDAKIILAKFLSGKKYRVMENDSVGTNVNLAVEINNVSGNFTFPFEVSGTKLQKSATFYINDAEYPFSSLGLKECIEDIKNGTLKKASISRNMENGYVINREEIIRRYNGSLRQATDKINSLLKDGTIVGVGSNSYGTFYSVDELFPQMEKEKSQERLAEFHFSPNQEHIATNEYKSSEYLKVEASKILKQHFNDFKLEASKRDEKKLVVKAKVLNNKGVEGEFVFGFKIENEKLKGETFVNHDGEILSIEKMAQKFNNSGNDVLDKFAMGSIFNNKIGSKYILTKRDIEDKLFKVAQVSNVDALIDNWVSHGLVKPINSQTYATDKSFGDLLSLSKISSLSNEELEEINEYERKFGNDIIVETDVNQLKEHYSDLEDIEASKEKKVFSINNYISKKIKNYRVASIYVKGNDKYRINIDLINKNTGTRHSIPLEVKLEGSKVISCVANISNKIVPLEDLLNHFSKNKILSLYLQDSNGSLNAGPILITESGMRKKLKKVITATKVDSVLSDWVSEGKVSRLDDEHLASDYSFQELLATVDDSNMISIGEMEERGYQERHFGKQIKVKTDDRVEDTGTRESEERWSEERKLVAFSDKISKLFKEYDILFTDEEEDRFYVTSTVKNPASGLRLKLRFTFSNVGGKVGHLLSVSDDKDNVSIDKVANLLSKHTSEASSHYGKYHKMSSQTHNVVINKNNLQDKLKVVATKLSVPLIIDNFVEKGYLQPISSSSYASKFTVGELVSVASEKLNIKEAQEEFNLYKKEEGKLNMPEKYEQGTDTREIKETVRLIDNKLAHVKEKLITYTYKAAKEKKITMNKCGQFLHNLENSKTVQDLEKVSRELKNYYK